MTGDGSSARKISNCAPPDIANRTRFISGSVIPPYSLFTCPDKYWSRISSSHRYSSAILRPHFFVRAFLRLADVRPEIIRPRSSSVLCLRIYSPMHLFVSHKFFRKFFVCSFIRPSISSSRRCLSKNNLSAHFFVYACVRPQKFVPYTIFRMDISLYFFRLFTFSSYFSFRHFLLF